MCGRIVLISPIQALMREFQLADAPELQPGYNIAPGRPIPVVLPGPAGLRLQFMHWGLTPPWARPGGASRELINARSETADRKAVFAASYARRRCVIPADAFYEWQRGRGGNQPYLFQAATGGLLALAGIWAERSSSAADPRAACVILTTGANRTMLPVHDRMPVLLPGPAWRLWLAPETPGDRLAGLCRPAQDDFLARHAVTRQVSRPAFDGPACLDPVEPEDPQQGDLFSR